MQHNPDKHQRQSIRLKGYDYSQAGVYFVTICAQGRECLFGEVADGVVRVNDFGAVLMKMWDDLPNHYENVALDEFIVMPNHVHGIIILRTDPVGAIHELPLQKRELPLPNGSMIDNRKCRRQMTLSKIVGRFKMNAAKRVNELRQTPGVSVWQRNYYEHVIRNEKELDRVREYIAYNPAGWMEDEEHPMKVQSRQMNERS